MKVSDALVDWLLKKNINNGFGLQGGAAAHIFDSMASNAKFSCHFFHHEQHAAQAAVGYSKFCCKPSVVVVTTGPGGTNALTGLLAAWQDSVPVLFISGQSRLDQTSYGKNVRQVGSQEAPILDVVTPLTKWSRLLEKPEDLLANLEEAYDQMVSGRPGPVWLDIPVNVSWEHVSQETVEQSISLQNYNNETIKEIVKLVVKEFKISKRPLLLLGGGARSSGIVEYVKDFAEEKKLPVVMTWLATDAIESSSEICGGTIGAFGQKGANSLMFDSDFVLCLGANLGVNQTGNSNRGYCPNSKIICVTNDRLQAECSKANFSDIHVLDLKLFWPEFIDQIAGFNLCAQDISSYREKNYKGKVDIRLPSPSKEPLFAPRVVYEITKSIKGHVVIDGGGTALYAGFQASFRHLGMRTICSTSISSMGTALPEAFGVLAGGTSMPISLIIGDGSFNMNLSALAKLVNPPVPVVVIVLNNDGYLAIRHTQRDYLDARYVGVNTQDDLYYPEIINIAKTYRADFFSIKLESELQDLIRSRKLMDPGLHIIEAIVNKHEDCLFRQQTILHPDGRIEALPLADMAN